MVPENYFLRVINKHFDWNFVYDEVEKLYSTVGRKSIDSVVLVKVIDLLIEWNCLDMALVYIDSTHTKAYTNKKKNILRK